MNENITNYIFGFVLLCAIIFIRSPNCKCEEPFLNIENCNAQNSCNQVSGFIDNDTNNYVAKDQQEKVIAENDDNEKKVIHNQAMHPICSPACCVPQYPVPFKITNDEIGSEYIKTGMTCNNSWQSTGCLCMTKDYDNFLRSRGRNNE